MSLTIILFTASPLLAVSRSEQAVMSGATVCQAKVLSKNSLVMQSHCLENDQALIIEDFGQRTIARVHGKNPQLTKNIETLVTVELRENIFPLFEHL